VKLLIDNCLSSRLAAALMTDGHDVASVAEWPADPGDREVLAFAAREARVLITADRGFGELVVTARLPTAGLIVLKKMPPSEHYDACLRALAQYGEDLAAGAFVIVTGERMRARLTDPDA
jgi:predicted nuclease of predicted toxin-antitoxin system